MSACVLDGLLVLTYNTKTDALTMFSNVRNSVKEENQAVDEERRPVMAQVLLHASFPSMEL